MCICKSALLEKKLVDKVAALLPTALYKIVFPRIKRNYMVSLHALTAPATMTAVFENPS